MLDKLTCADVLPALNQAWRLTDSEGTAVELVLIQAAERPQAYAVGISQRMPFFMAFRGPRWPEIPQGLYILEHEAVGKLDQVLVTPLHMPYTASQTEVRHYQVGFA